MVTTPTGAILQIQATATTGNTGGAGFNPTATYFNADLAATVANTSAPVVTSASYTFLAGDVNAYVYVKSGTHWQAGWYQIASVAGGAATLTATIGSVITSIGITGIVTTNSAVGCTSDNTATLSSGTYGIDYSQQDAIQFTSSTATSSGAGSVILFAGSAQSMLGNYVHIISGTNATAGWYEIIAESVGVSITTDRASTTGVGASIVMNIGGAGRLNGLEDTFQAVLPAGAIVWVKNGAYTLSQAISTASTNGTATSSIYWIGYNSTRGDTCNGANRPVITAGANAVTISQYQSLNNLSFTSTASAGISLKTGAYAYNCKFLNTSTTSGRAAVTPNATSADIINCECISQNGIAINKTGAIVDVIGCYIHDSNKGIQDNSGGVTISVNNIFEGCTTSGVENSTAGSNTIVGNTFYGREAQIGTGVNFSGLANSSANRIANNIFYGLATGINIGTGTASSNFSQNNDFNNNGTDATNWTKSPTDIALNPTFTNASQLTGSTATTSASVLTDSGATFGVTDNVDYLHITSGTGVTVGVYLITSHTSTTLTVNNALGTSNAGNVVYWVTHGHNFQIGTNLKAQGFPSFTNATGSQTTSYPDVGAVQIQATNSARALAFAG